MNIYNCAALAVTNNETTSIFGVVSLVGIIKLKQTVVRGYNFDIVEVHICLLFTPPIDAYYMHNIPLSGTVK